MFVCQQGAGSRCRSGEASCLARSSLSGPHPLSPQQQADEDWPCETTPWVQHGSSPRHPAQVPTAPGQRSSRQLSEAASDPELPSRSASLQASSSGHDQQHGSSTQGNPVRASAKQKAGGSAGQQGLAQPDSQAFAAGGEAAKWAWMRRKAKEQPLLAAPISAGHCAEDMHLSLTIGVPVHEWYLTWSQSCWVSGPLAGCRARRPCRRQLHVHLSAPKA